MVRNGPLRVGMVGYAFMGRAHALAWREAPRFFDLACDPQLSVLVGRNEQAVREAAANLGFAETGSDWRELVRRPDVDVVDICTPGDSHAEIAIAALEAGKHVLCEKPLANTVAEADAMVAAAARAAEHGVRAMVGFNYRRVPAAALARNMVASGAVGEVRHVRATYLQDWIVDPEFPLVWRLQKEHAGSGALGDIGAHIIDLAQFMLGDRVIGVSALTETFVKERPFPSASSGLAAQAGTDRGIVTVDDAALFMARFGSGAIGTFEATRFATGRKNELRIEINGSAGSIVFNMESMNELQFYDGSDPAASAGFRRILVTEPEHPYLQAWWPAGHILGWDHTFIHEIRDFVDAIVTGADVRPSFADGLQVQRVLQTVEDSAAAGSSWTPVPA
jgi:predicted dehydrogenase